jgi:hypothetical protein
MKQTHAVKIFMLHFKILRKGKLYRSDQARIEGTSNVESIVKAYLDDVSFKSDTDTFNAEIHLNADGKTTTAKLDTEGKINVYNIDYSKHCIHCAASVDQGSIYKDKACRSCGNTVN